MGYIFSLSALSGMKTAILTLIIFITSFVSLAQSSSLRIAFYNVENLFDIYDDPEKNDDEFLPGGIKGWNYDRYQCKLRHLYKTILAIEGDSRLAALGLCELENCFVTRQLLTQTPLAKRRLKFIQYESPDRRGVDVAFVYDPRLIVPLHSHAITIRFPFDTAGRTRDILYVKAIVKNLDTIHFFVNHWPSRFGGLMATIPKRNYVASVVAATCDSILASNKMAKIIIMGDLNDDPEDESVLIHLQTKKSSLVNLMDDAHWKEPHGTLKHGSVWSIFDQIVVSYGLYNAEFGYEITGRTAHFCKAPFLFTEDPKSPGKKLFRTYSGMNYIGGFGDHLPVFIDVNVLSEGK